MLTKEVLKVETQHALELERIDAGARRYWENWQRQDGVGSPESDLIGRVFEIHLRRIEKLQRRLSSGRSLSRRWDSLTRAILVTARPTEIAGISLLVPVTSCFGGQAGYQPLSSLASSVASALRRSLVIDQAMTHWKTRQQELRHITAEWDYQKAFLFLRRVDMNPERWPHDVAMRLGYTLLREALISNLLGSVSHMHERRDIYRNALGKNHNAIRLLYAKYKEQVEECGLFNLELLPAGRRTVARMGFTNKAFESLIDGHSSIQDLRPAYGPMVVPPVDWTTDFDGGFILLRNPITKPVRGNHVPAGVNQEIREALNTLQRTAYTFDTTVVDAIDYVYNTLGGDRAGLPSRSRPEMPVARGGDDLKAVKLERKLIWDEWYNEQSKRLTVLKTLSEARRLSPYSPIYFAWNMCFRGRMHPFADCISPQGADYQKGMLLFAKKEKVDDDKWLLINLANLYGVDKVSFEKRIAWARKHMVWIMNTANDFRDTIEWWELADKPFCLLAACLDYKRWKETGYSQIPVCMDGSCNGIQHLSALGRDLVGAKSTNLVDAPVPNDIYSDVSTVLDRLIRESDSEYAQLFPPGSVDRKLVKRATMTTPYGVTRQGIRTQYITDGHLKRLPKQMHSEVSSWLTGMTTEAISQVVQSAAEVMQWLKYLAAEANKRGQPLIWTTPDGKTVTQHYLKRTDHTLRILGMGKVKIRVADSEESINKHNQLNGTAPNFVHSLDATHARMYITRLGGDIQFVHDSVGCHANRVDEMRDIIRDTFVEMHKEPLLERLQNEVAEQLDFTPEPPPIVGTLDLSLVSSARYLFA